MALLPKNDKEKLLLQIKHELGYPFRPIQLEVDQFDSFIEMVIEDYSTQLNDWLVQQQWVGLQGLDIDESSFVHAFSTKSNDFMKSFTYAYSKQVGLGTNSPAAPGWELKRDFITTMSHTQHYVIPAGREVNEVLWDTPPSVDKGLVDPFALGNWSSGGFGWSYMGRPAQYVQPTYSLLLAAQDRRTKERILQSELTYRITGMETGEKILHLYPIPGSRGEIRDTWGKHYEGRKVWYFYYDTKDSGRDKCLEENDDTVLLPSDPPIKTLKWSKMNSSARKYIRDLLLAKSKIVIGGIRGFYSGDLGVADKEIVMDYRHLLDEGKELKEETEAKIKETLDKISLLQLTEDRAKIAENVNNERSFQPPMFPIVTM